MGATSDSGVNRFGQKFEWDNFSSLKDNFKN
jgi:hypothetical protein